MKHNLVNDDRAGSTLSTSIGQHENNQSIADRIEALAIELRTMSNSEMETIPTQVTLLALAAKIYSARRKVDEVFGMAGFAVSPAWDMMLDLYRAKANNRDISVTSACIGGACAATTGLRWLQVLENMQLIVRKPDQDDRRRQVIEITDGGKVKIEMALSAHL